MTGYFTLINESDDDVYSEKYLDEKLNDKNKEHYISEIKEYLDSYLLAGTVSFKSKNIRNLFKLTDEELDILKTIHFLLNDNVKELFIKIPYLLRNLSHSTNKKDIESHGIIMGNINWSKTIKTRFSKGFNDHSLFICSLPSKHYDLIENRILKFVLKKIIFRYENHLTFLKSNKSNINFENLNNEYDNWYEQVCDIYKLSIQTIRNVYFNDITDLDEVSANDLNKLYNHRNSLYQYVAMVFELYENLFINDNKECLINLIQNQLIVASNNDTLFEIYVFFNLISILDKKCIENSFEMGLFHLKKNNPVSAKLNDGRLVKVYYQNVPEVFSKNSLYRSLTENNEFNFSTSIRRPDLIVEIEKYGKSFHRIIEVKNSSRADYMRNSFYKVLGYYKDFESVSFTDNIPIVVVNWMGSSMDSEQEEKIFKKKIIFFNKEEFKNNIEILLDI